MHMRYIKLLSLKFEVYVCFQEFGSNDGKLVSVMSSYI